MVLMPLQYAQITSEFNLILRIRFLLPTVHTLNCDVISSSCTDFAHLSLISQKPSYSCFHRVNNALNEINKGRKLIIFYGGNFMGHFLALFELLRAKM